MKFKIIHSVKNLNIKFGLETGFILVKNQSCYSFNIFSYGIWTKGENEVRYLLLQLGS